MDRLFFYHSLLFGSCGYAFVRGHTDARIVAAVFLIGNYATSALRSPLSAYSSLELGILTVDVLALVAFTCVACVSERFWPLWVGGLQLTTTLGHLLKAFDPHLLALSYAVALRFWSYPMLITLAVGVWRNQRRLQDTKAPLHELLSESDR